MTGKPYGKFTLVQLKQFNDFVHEVKNLPIELEKLLQQIDLNKIHNIVGQNFSWIKYR
jgi:hypothetical protein